MNPRRFFTRRRRRREVEVAPPAPEVPAPALAALRGLGEPPARGDADDAELDTLRGELVRELDRIAGGGERPPGFRRG